MTRRAERGTLAGMEDTLHPALARRDFWLGETAWQETEPIPRHETEVHGLQDDSSLITYACPCKSEQRVGEPSSLREDKVKRRVYVSGRNSFHSRQGLEAALGLPSLSRFRLETRDEGADAVDLLQLFGASTLLPGQRLAAPAFELSVIPVVQV